MSETTPSVGNRSEQSPKHTSWRRRVGRAGLLLTEAVVFSAPFASVYALTQTEVQDNVASIPSTLSFQYGRSSIDTGLLGSVSGNGQLTEHSIGVKVELDNPPVGIADVTAQPTRQISQPFVGFYRDPEIAFEGNRNALLSEAKSSFIRVGLGGVALYGVLRGLQMASMKRDTKSQKILSTSLTLTTILTPTLVGAAPLVFDWVKESKTYPYPISQFDGTQLEGATASSSETAAALNQLIPFFAKQIEREDERRSEFEAEARLAIDRALARGDFEPPEPDTTTVLLISDIHSNLAMINIYTYLVDKINEKYGEDTIKIVVSAGDNSYGSASEENSIERLGKVADEVVSVDGNHDGDTTRQNEEKAGIRDPSGEDINLEGLTIGGGNDPSLTTVGNLLSFGGNVDRGSGEPISFTEQKELQYEQSEKLYEESLASMPSILAVHEPYALRSFTGLDDINEQDLDQWFKGRSESVDIPTDIIFAGHTHPYRSKIRIVPTTDGDNGVVALLGSAGGAPTRNTITNLSTPFTAPLQPASVLIAKFDTSEDTTKLLSVQELTTSRAGVLRFREPIQVNERDVGDFFFDRGGGGN